MKFSENKDDARERAVINSAEHIYRIPILDTLHGVGLAHRYVMLLGQETETITAKLREAAASQGVDEVDSISLFKWLVSGEPEDAFSKMRQTLSKLLDMDHLFELTSMLLEGAEIDDEKCDELGMCKLFRRKPHELYTALMMAIAANYPDYFPFLTDRLVTEDSLSQE